MEATLRKIPVLVLNASYEPISVVTAQRALKWYALNAIAVEVAREHEVRRGVKLPSVVRLLEFRRVPRSKVRCTRKNILLRDLNTCQYCGTTLPRHELTLDHVIPKAQGGPDTWDNLVAACHSCNTTKADKTPEQDDAVAQAKADHDSHQPFSDVHDGSGGSRLAEVSVLLREVDMLRDRYTRTCWGFSQNLGVLPGEGRSVSPREVVGAEAQAAHEAGTCTSSCGYCQGEEEAMLM